MGCASQVGRFCGQRGVTWLGKAIQVMLVDDSAESRQSMRMLLELAEDVRVLAEASDGVEALQQLTMYTPDVVVMDMNMPGMDGVAATEIICTQFPNISVVVVSVQDDFECVRRCMLAGAKEYLSKPVDAEALISAVRGVGRVQRPGQTARTVGW